MAADNNERVIFDFTDPSEVRQWIPVNDVVMGGVSQSTFIQGEPSTAVFSGTVSLENYGGFCSVGTRSSRPDNLSRYRGIAVRLKTDGKRYKLTMKNDSSFSGYSYQYPFTAKADVWTVIRAPFDSFTASFRGRMLPDAEPLDSASIAAFGLLVSDKQAGPFKIIIDWIKAY